VTIVTSRSNCCSANVRAYLGEHLSIDSILGVPEVVTNVSMCCLGDILRSQACNFVFHARFLKKGGSERIRLGTDDVGEWLAVLSVFGVLSDANLCRLKGQSKLGTHLHVPASLLQQRCPKHCGQKDTF
jgi:hypothetical protein